ncbi:MAG: hypothetical protein HN742_02755 [Lentisphaerae bacterium]|jgi:hypothetical protein|nr:hypothetical protein [Lentisphaerota bacterium]MBT5607492.1 hypothetical protein [Lentisphaerota bacterium]MBT7059923.1 hypothetical protein [Lentisphaerota bacterium]MBT7840759.1 hypothetical protein [Lentisphaerota bacterium]
MFNRSARKADVDLADSLSGTASGSTFSRIAGGVVTAIVLSLFGLRACITRNAMLPGSRGAKLELSGPAAVSLGVALVAAGFFLHVHFVWTTSERLYRWADVGKGVSLAAFIGGLGCMGWQIAMG